MGGIVNAWAGVLGGLFGLGAVLMVLSVPSLQRDVRFRIAPYIADVSEGAFELIEQRRADSGVSSRVLAALRRLLVRFGPSGSELERLMRRAGQSGGAARARLTLLLSGLVGVGAGAGISLIASGPLIIRLLLPVVAGIAAGWLSLRLLIGRANRRCAQIERELPTVLEFLSLCIASGEALPDAIARVARVGSGELVAELGEVNRMSRLGVPLPMALTSCSTELAIPALTRLTTQLVAALDRGSPLGEVLKAQAADQRVQFKRELLESAGRKEIAMMLPLVFLILPITVLFAVWPGLIAFNTGYLP